MSDAQKKQPQNATRWKNGLCGVFAAALFALSALTHVAVAAHAGVATHELCVSAELAAPTSSDQASNRHAKLAFSHCDACAMAKTPILAARTHVAGGRQSVRLTPFYAHAFELIERRRAGETRSRAPPQFS